MNDLSPDEKKAEIKEYRETDLRLEKQLKSPIKETRLLNRTMMARVEQIDKNEEANAKKSYWIQKLANRKMQKKPGFE